MALTLDDDGHLADADQWSESLARRFAMDAGVVLGDDHWRVIRIVRSFHAATGLAPSMRPLVRLLRDAGARDLASSIALLRLFPESPAACVAKIAGLPRPDKCL